MTKLTYSVALDNAIAILNADSANAETVEKLEALKTQLEKRNGSRGQTKTQKENEALKPEIFAFVGTTDRVRAGEVATQFNISGQKASALLKQMVTDGQLERFTEKKVTFFKVAEA